MQAVRANRVREFLKEHSVILWIGFFTGMMIILFQSISQLVIYHYVKLDYYLCGVAIFFLVTGIQLSSTYRKPVISTFPWENLLDLLSNKEIIVLRMVHDGKTNKEIAAALFIEISTVKTHVNHIYSKISVSNRREARNKYSELTEKRLI